MAAYHYYFCLLLVSVFMYFTNRIQCIAGFFCHVIVELVSTKLSHGSPTLLGVITK